MKGFAAKNLEARLTSNNRSPFFDGSVLEEQDSLSNFISSPERYANALNLTISQVSQLKQQHNEASQQLHEMLKDPTSKLTGQEKHQLICQHRFQYGRHPFICNNCWSYTPVCICQHPLVRRRQQEQQTNSKSKHKRKLPDINVRDKQDQQLEVVVWTHHREWGLSSNTGCIIPLMFDNCYMLMKGLPEHDAKLDNYLKDDNCLVVILWPSNDHNGNDDDGNKPTKSTSGNLSKDDSVSSTSFEDFLEMFQNDQQLRKKKKRRDRSREVSSLQRVVLVAVDGTWRNARRMVSKLPSTVPRLDLSSDIVHQLSGKGGGSILAPLRSRDKNGGGGRTGRQGDGPTEEEDDDDRHVCTAQAIVGALATLGLAHNDVRDTLAVTKVKVDLIRRYRGKANT